MKTMLLFSLINFQYNLHLYRFISILVPTYILPYPVLESVPFTLRYGPSRVKFDPVIDQIGSSWLSRSNERVNVDPVFDEPDLT